MEKKQRQLGKLSSQKGFTLIEMMIVIAIIGMIMGLVGLKVTQKLDEARVSMTKTQIRTLGTILDDFRRVCGFYPTTEQGLDALVKAPTAGRLCKSYDPEGFTKAVPKDGWGNDFIYTSDGGSHYVIKSNGPAGVPGDKGAISSEDAD
jgi:general secretion pathway protein G